MTQILLSIAILFICISIFVSLGAIVIPIEKLGIPIFPKRAKWTLFILRNIKKAEIIDKNHLKINGYIIVFYYSRLFEIYEGDSLKEISTKYSLGGQSNKADYLTWWEKIIGRKIEQFYTLNINV